MFNVELTAPYRIGELAISALDLQMAGVAALCLAVAFGTLYFTSIGRQMRAVADNPDLARVSGIQPERVMIALWCLVGAITAVAGLILGIKTVVSPEIGWEMLLPAFAAAILGGIGSPVGAVLAGLLLGAAQELSTPLRRLHLQDRAVVRRHSFRAPVQAARIVRTSRGRAMMTAYLVAVFIIVLIYLLLSLGLTIQYGLTGLINFGLVGFFAIGAYVSALLAINGVPLVVSFLAASIVAGLAAWPIGLVALRLRDDYFAIVTLGFSETVRLVIVNESWLTNGVRGITGVPGLFQNAGSVRAAHHRRRAARRQCGGRSCSAPHRQKPVRARARSRARRRNRVDGARQIAEPLQDRGADPRLGAGGTGRRLLRPLRHLHRARTSSCR